ncbi:hypothetical protein LTR64_008093 [Lithohypha guttulata]|uniref:uncharacterized protein n=1 Tax=Lithohypha guttulata TaxID=1690604 RepID=UPI002DE1DB8B|nr:hypothetical protein LTR51_008037 [Lithohypha guttulata]
MSSSSISSLSAELLTLIVNCLGSDTSSLHSLCLVSKVFSRLATPNLYTTYQQPESWPPEKATRFISYVRTILSRPDLAVHVKHVALGKADSDEGLVDSVSPDFVDLCRDRITSLWSPKLTEEKFVSEWVEGIKQALPEALQGVLLSSLPNIESLYFEEGYQPKHLFQVLDAVTESDPSAKHVPARKLRSVRTLSVEGKYGYLDFAKCSSFFRLPTLRNFEIGLANGEWSEDSVWNVPAHSAAVEKLSFQYSALTCCCMRQIVRSCASLREFRFTYGRIHMYSVHFTPKELLEELLAHAATLEAVWLNFDDNWQKGEWEEIPTERLVLDTSLKQLNKLKTMSINSHALLGHGVEPIETFVERTNRPFVLANLADMLPESIEFLEIIGCTEVAVFPQLVVLRTAQRQGRLTRVSTIRLIWANEILKPDVSRADIERFEMPGVRIDNLFMNVRERDASIDTAVENTSSELFGKDLFLLQGS